MAGNDKVYEDRLAAVLGETKTILFDYSLSDNNLVLFDQQMAPVVCVPAFLSVLENADYVPKEDRWKAIGFFSGTLQGPVDVDVCFPESIAPAFDMPVNARRKMHMGAFTHLTDGAGGMLRGYARDVTEERQREVELEERAQRDTLTKLYNSGAGKELANSYLASKDPYTSCGLFVIDIDFFKAANDSFGHQFGNTVLVEVARLLSMMFRPDDVVMRMGGDEFVVLLKGIDHASLMKKARQLVETMRTLAFPEHNYSITCSVGVCFLPENVAGYTFDRLFKNADWALYRAKENGRNRYEFCDYLQRYELAAEASAPADSDIDTRYLHSDVVSVAFEVFEKTGSFNEAIKLLLEILGIRFQLDRITVIQTEIQQKKTTRQYQWLSNPDLEVLQQEGSFTKEDFLTLFNSYDEYGTTVLQYDDMGAYSPGATALLMQGEAKTVLYAALYCEGRYTGAVSYVTCGAKRFWSRQDRAKLGELTKIISAHLAKNQALNALTRGAGALPEYDSLTGLLSFHRFREEVERLIVGGFGASYALVYYDFDGLRRLNEEYGFSTGDMLLKEFSTTVAGEAEIGAGSFFARIVADHFVLFVPYDDIERTLDETRRLSNDLEREWAMRYPKARLRLRAGVYAVEPSCVGVSVAVDAANFARQQAIGEAGCPVVLYDEAMAHRRKLEHNLATGVEEALKNKQVKVYLQPRMRLSDGTVAGAEALVRWVQDDGTILLPDDFIPLFERNGKVIELDLYVLDQVAAFLSQCEETYGHALPVSVNASILHAADKSTADRYRNILEERDIDPACIQVEFAESDTIASSGGARQLLGQLQEQGIQTALDDFGSAYSQLTGLVDAPMDVVKLGRSFMKSCLESSHGTLLLKQMIDLMKHLGYRVVCEGIETEQQAETLRDMGCDEAQGYLFSRPLPLEEFERFAYEGSKSAT